MQLWTPEHAQTLLPSIIAMIAIAIVLRLCLRRCSHKVRMIPVQIIAVILFAIEIGKQWISISRGYDLYHLPFHFCSLFIFMMPIMAFYKGKYQQRIYGITAAICMAVFILTSIYPALIYSGENVKLFFQDYMSFHTVFFHNLVMLAALLIPALELHEPKKGDAKIVVLFIIGFCIVSASMSYIHKTNFNNFYVCNIAPLETIRMAVETACGKLVASILYVSIVTVLDIFFVLGSYWFYRLVRNLFTRKKALQTTK